MLPYTVHGSGEVTLLLMPFLGGTQAEWAETVGILSQHHRCVTVDLPGFGDAASIPGYSVAEMADAVTELLIALKPERYVLVGHSMAGKVSAVVTRHLVDDGSKMHPPMALVLIAPSPPGPEPMSDSKRSQMLAMFDSPPDGDFRAARNYIKDNISCVIPEAVLDRTAHEVLRMNRAAWTAWLESGSKEDWGQRVGILDLPVLLVAGLDDGSLGPAVQAKVTETHFPAAHLITVDCGHLIPVDQPDETAALISNFLKVF